MYQVGELVLYGNTGVCKITEISSKELPGTNATQLYYTMKPLHQECMIFTPVDNKKVFMRPVISKHEAERLIDTIPGMETQIYHSSVMSELTQHYEASFQTHDCADLIVLTMSIYAKKRSMEEQKRRFGAVDERFMKRAEELLFSELAAALGIARDDVPGYIEKRVGTKS